MTEKLHRRLRGDPPHDPTHPHTYVDDDPRVIEDHVILALALREGGVDCTAEEARQILTGEARPPQRAKKIVADAIERLPELMELAQARLMLHPDLLQAAFDRFSHLGDADIRRRASRAERMHAGLVITRPVIVLPRHYKHMVKSMARAMRVEMGELVTLWVECLCHEAARRTFMHANALPGKRPVPQHLKGDEPQIPATIQGKSPTARAVDEIKGNVERGKSHEEPVEPSAGKKRRRSRRGAFTWVED